MDISRFYPYPLLYLLLALLTLKEPHTHAHAHPQPQIKPLPGTLLTPGRQLLLGLAVCVSGSLGVFEQEIQDLGFKILNLTNSISFECTCSVDPIDPSHMG